MKDGQAFGEPFDQGKLNQGFSQRAQGTQRVFTSQGHLI